MIIQIVGTLIILAILFQLIRKIITDKASFLKMIFWLFFWGLGLLIIWLPKDTLDKLGDIFGVGRGVDVLIYLSIIFLFYNNLRLNRKIDRLQKDITKIVRKIAKTNS